MISDKDKILLIGAGKNQLPYLEAFLKRGYSVIAVDRDPQAPGFKKAEISLPISIHDTQRVMEAVANLPEKGKITGIACPSTGVPYITAAGCASMLNLLYPSKETVLTLLDKHKLWKILHKHRMTGRRCLALKELDGCADHIALPVVLKPQLAGGGHRGVSFCSSKTELPQAFEKAAHHSVNRGVVIESFCAGKEYKVGGLVQGGEVKLCLTAQLIFGSDGLSGLPIALGIGPSNDLQINELGRLFAQHIKTVCRRIGLETAPFNVDVIVTSKGIEVIDFDIVLGSFDRLANMSLGLDMFAAYADLCLGRELDLNSQCFHGAATTYLWFIADDIPADTIIKVCKDASCSNVFENRLPNSKRISTDTPVCAGCLFSEGQFQEAALSAGEKWLERVQNAMSRLYPERFNLIMPTKA